MTRTDLSRAIAGLDDWQRAGVRVVDPETGASYRRLPNAWVNESDHSTNGISGNQSPSCVRAIAAGPDPHRHLHTQWFAGGQRTSPFR